MICMTLRMLSRLMMTFTVERLLCSQMMVFFGAQSWLSMKLIPWN
ncbi:hypothetical protein HanPSC8_Chr04g0173361 [Helianthus annuus]|nr:hypothetical protein HanPSC8_Chr04g0173361 [Helianthus annuus]